jgi:hypothetical protein
MNTIQLLLNLRQQGVKTVLLNGWNEKINYVLSLDTSNVEYVGKESDDSDESNIHYFKTKN